MTKNNKNYFRKKHRVRKKKPFLENNIIFSFFIVLFLFVFFVVSLIFNPKFTVEIVEIENEKRINKVALTKLINEDISTNFLFLTSKSIFLASQESIRDTVLEKIPIIENIYLKKIFPNKIKINIKERTPRAVWCYRKDKSTCSYIDGKGVVFERVDSFKKNYPVIVASIDNISMGEKIIDKNNINTFYFLQKELSLIGVRVNYFLLPEPETLKLQTDKGWHIYFSSEKLEKQLDNLNLIITEIENDQIVDYIDLRFGDRIFYK